MTDRLNVAVIGCGGHAQHHFRMIAAEPRVHLVAVADVDPTRLENAAETHGPVRTFDDHRRLLDEVTDLHVVHVTTMPGHLVAIVLDCLERGLHVSVEKPPGMSSADTQRMVEAEQQSDGKAIVSFNRRYMPQVLAVRQLAQAAGGAVHVSGTYNKPLSILGTSAMARILPDPVIGDAIHHVDIIRWLAGAGDAAARPVEVYSVVADGEREGSHRHNATVRFDTGAIGQLSSHYGVGARIQRAEVHAEDLSVYLDLTGSPRVELLQAEAQGGVGTQTRSDPPDLDLAGIGGEHFDEVQHFTDCIFEDRTPWSTLEDAVHTMRLAEAIRHGHQGPLA